MAMLPDLSTESAFKAAINYDGPVDQRQREGKTLEMKHPKKLDAPGDLAHTIAAFANTSGGTLVIGVGEGKDEASRERYADGLFDVAKPQAAIEKVQNKINDLLEPNPSLNPDYTIVDGKRILWFEVQPSMSIVAVRKKGGKSLLFPVRTVHGNAYMGAKQVENHILNPYRIRRLELEDAMQRGNVWVANKIRLPGYGRLIVRKLEDTYFEATLPAEQEGGIMPSLIYVPYEAVEMVTPTPRDGTLVHIRGEIGPRGTDLTHLEYKPFA